MIEELLGYVNTVNRIHIKLNGKFGKINHLNGIHCFVTASQAISNSGTINTLYAGIEVYAFSVGNYRIIQIPLVTLC